MKLSIKLFILAFILMPITTFAQSAIIELIIPFLEEKFSDKATLIGAIISVSYLINDQLLTNILKLDVNKWVKAIVTLVVWLAVLYLGIWQDLGFLEGLTYFQGIELTVQDWLTAAGVYSLIKTIPILDKILKIGRPDNNVEQLGEQTT